MILGIGVDIVEIRRIKNIVDNNIEFLNRIFNDEEIEYFKSRRLRPEFIAGTFAAKEAVAKALGTGFRGFGFRDICIYRDELGKPEVVLKNNAKHIADIKGKHKMHISISHGEDSAIAYAVLEGEIIENSY